MQEDYKVRNGTYGVSFVESAETYDKHNLCYVAAKSATFTWDQLNKVVVTVGRREAKDGSGIIPSSIEIHAHKKTGRFGRWRQRIGCTETNLLILDIEGAAIGDDQTSVIEWFESHFPQTRALIYTTWNHGNPRLDEDGVPKWVEGEPRIRVIIPLLDPVDSQSDWRLFYEWVIEHCDGAVDKACKDPCRVSYLFRARNPAAVIEPWFVELDGSDLDPESLPDGSSLTALKAEHVKVTAERNALHERRAQAARVGLAVNASDSQLAKYAAKTLEGSCDEIQRASAGARHDTIYRKAYRLGTMIAANMIDEYDVVVSLTAAAARVLPASRYEEARRTINDGIRDGVKTPFDTRELTRTNRRVNLRKVIDWDNVDLSKPIGLDLLVVEGGRHE